MISTKMAEQIAAMAIAAISSGLLAIENVYNLYVIYDDNVYLRLQHGNFS
jgi:hypothetical protein